MSKNKTSTKPVISLPKSVKAFAASMNSNKEKSFVKAMVELEYKDLIQSRTRGKKND